MIEKKRTVRVQLHLITAFLSFLCIGACERQSPTSTGTSKDVTIGAVLPLTGDAGTFGKNASRGAELAVKEANVRAKNNAPKFILKVEDSRGDASEAVSATRKLIDANSARLLIGDVTSAGTHAIIPIVTRAKIPLVSPAASDPKLSGSSEFFCRVWPSDNYEAQVIGRYVGQQGLKKLAVVLANTDYGVAMVDELVKVVGQDRIALKIPVDRETQDYRPAVERIKNANPDALFLILYPEDARRLLQQLNEQQIELPILATATFEDPKLASSPGASRIVFASPVPPKEDDPGRKQFAEKYRAAFGEEPAILSDTGYDAAMILIDAYQRHGEDSSAAMKYIKSLRNYAGVSGIMTFSESGDVQKPYRLKTVRDGQFVWKE